MGLENSLRRLSSVVSDLEKIAANAENDVKSRQIDLFGGSYGTRIEAAIQAHEPQGVRAVVQDSPWPPEADWTVGGPAMVSTSIDIVMAKCAVVAECARRYPDLKAKLAVVAERFLAGPQTVGGKTYTADDLGGYLMDASYFTAGVLPRDLWKIIEGDLSPVADFMRTLIYASVAMVLLMAAATTAVVLLAARAGLETHRDTIAILHMLGSTDVQVARLFQRRIALDTMGGGVIGTLAAMLAIWALTAQMAELGSELVAGATLTRGDWLLLALLPALFALVATVAARIAVLGRLRLVQ